MSDQVVKDGRLVAKRAMFALASFLVIALGVLWLDPAQVYVWAKALHVIAVMSWMAGLLYLPRLFVYHADVPAGSERAEMLTVMENRLLKVIMTPAMILSWVLGLWLAWVGFKFIGGWLHVKFAAVLVLSGCHGYLAKSARLFAGGNNRKSSGHWRLVNEVPTLLMIVSVVLVIVKPF